jgi:Trypsin-like peptidase domain
MASGVLVSADGFIVTNAHVVEGCRTMTATYINAATRRSYAPVLRYYDKKTDTAVRKIPDQGLDFFSVPARALRVGERVYATGNLRGLEQSISEGIVSGNPDRAASPAQNRTENFWPQFIESLSWPQRGRWPFHAVYPNFDGRGDLARRRPPWRTPDSIRARGPAENGFPPHTCRSDSGSRGHRPTPGERIRLDLRLFFPMRAT